MQSRAFAASLITIVSGVAVDIAHAQWTVTQLGPTDPPTESTVNAVSGGQQAGYWGGGDARACGAAPPPRGSISTRRAR